MSLGVDFVACVEFIFAGTKTEGEDKGNAEDLNEVGTVQCTVRLAGVHDTHAAAEVPHTDTLPALVPCK